MNSRILLKIIPYITAFLVGILFYEIGYIFNDFKDLFINISASFFVLPLLYLFYETTAKIIHNRLNKEINDYAKLQVDRELLSIINQLQKIIFSIEGNSFSVKNIEEFLGLDKSQVELLVKSNSYLGFQIFKHWKISKTSITSLLENPFILGKMEDDKIIAIIHILKGLQQFEFIQKNDSLYIETGNNAKGFKIEKGTNINPDNKMLPERYLLLKDIGNTKYVVYDFGDIHQYNFKKCLKYYKINELLSLEFSTALVNIIKGINTWLDETGNEFILDSEQFRTSKN